MKIKNLTPHAITVRGTDGDVTFPPSGQVARVAVQHAPSTCQPFPGITLFTEHTGDVTGLPETDIDTMLIVSAMVRTASDRRDLVSPGELIRDAAGQPIGCKGLVGNWGRDLLSGGGWSKIE